MHCTRTLDDPTPEADPDVFTDDFSDTQPTEDYWGEAYSTNNCGVADRVYSSKVTDSTYIRLHVYERDIYHTSKIRFNDLSDLADVGVLARYNDTKAYILVCNKGGQWFIR